MFAIFLQYILTLILVSSFPPSTHAGTSKCRVQSLSPDQLRMKADWEDWDTHPPLEPTAEDLDFINTALASSYGVLSSRGRSLAPSCVRQEYRTLSDSQRRALHAAFNRLKTTVVPGTKDGRTEYEALTSCHRSDSAVAAHFGPAFLPWHREYLMRCERALQRHDPKVCLPYIDWTMDQGLPSPGQSAIWTDGYLGNNDGNVTTGFAANWAVRPDDCAAKWSMLYREIADDVYAKLLLFTEDKIAKSTQKTKFRDLCSPYSQRLERDHGSIHTMIGGHMNALPCASNDPVFFLHHAFIDCIWEDFRQNHQESNLESDYPDDELVPPNHHSNDSMLPFDKKLNIDGLSRNYTYSFYVCADRPSKNGCAENKDCKSEILWCNKETKKCTAKIREGGRCDLLPDDACYSASCKKPKNVNGVCGCAN